MSNPNESITGWLTTKTAPAPREFFEVFTRDGLFLNEESTYWDFKDKFPFSYSDDYFFGICRLICGFYNTFGGAIVFGVNDESRSLSKSKVVPNTDRLKSSLIDLCGQTPDFIMDSYLLDGEKVHLLLVCPRRNGEKILKFKKNSGKHRAGTIWVRDGHQIVVASPKHFPVLFGRRGIERPEAVTPRNIDGFLPSSPATIRNFVGRVSTLEKLFDWLENSDDPIQYLSGKGGSGKTTIAYEFAKIVKDYGSNLLAGKRDLIDFVIFISAKKIEFNPDNQRSVASNYIDFSDYEDMLRVILMQTGLSPANNDLDSLSKSALENELREILNSFSVLFVIDDIDTLTTAGTASGTEAMLRLLYQAKKNSRLLYTLRQRPSMNISTTIEVPGLDSKYEAPEFVEQCAIRFNVEPPADEFLEKQLGRFSEYRPLIIETVMALRRTAGSYDRALALAKTKSSEEMLGYVFEREWDTLKTRGGDGKMLLVAIRELGGKASFEQLRTVLEIDDHRINDAIAVAQEMFLTITSEGENSSYQLGGLTKAFIDLKRPSVVGSSTIRERAKHLKKDIKLKSEAIRLMERNAKFDIKENRIAKAYDDIRLKGEKGHVSDPFYRALRCSVACQYPGANFEDIRVDYQYVLNMKILPDFQFYYHFAQRCASDMLIEEIEKILTLVRRQNYGAQEKARISMILGNCKRNRSKAIWYEETQKAISLTWEAAIHFLNAFYWNCEGGAEFAEVSEQRAYETLWHNSKANYCSDYIHIFVSMLERVSQDKEIRLDPIQDLLVFIIKAIRAHIQAQRGETLKYNKPLEAAVKLMGIRERWLDAQALADFKAKIS